MQGFDTPPGGLQQIMHRPYAPLDLRQTLSAQYHVFHDNTAEIIARACIADAIRRAYPSSVEKVFSAHQESFPYPTMPEIDILPVRRNPSSALAPALHNEGTLDGTYGVHEDIFLEQYKLRRETDFETNLFLVYGDQKTAGLCRSVKLEQRSATNAFDRRRWLLAPAALFHLQMNYLWLIQRTHSGLDSVRDDRTTLIQHIDFLNRKGVAIDKAPFHLLEAVIRDSWDARVLALFYLLVSELQPGIEIARKETMDRYLSNLEPSQFAALIEKVRLAAFTPRAWRDTNDEIFNTHARFLQEGVVYLTLRHAIRKGDIGLVRRSILQTSVLFQGSGQTNYATEMLHMNWLLSDAASDKVLQRAILANSLVHTGKVWIPIDLSVELLNGNLKQLLRDRQNSTFNFGYLISTSALTVDYVSELRTTIEMAFGIRTNANHTSRSTSRDVHALAYLLCDTSMRRAQNRVAKFHAKDILQIGMTQMPKTIATFNRRLERMSGTAQEIGAEPRGAGDQLENEAQDSSTVVEMDESLDESRTADLPDGAPLADLSAVAQEINDGNVFIFED